VSKIVNSSPLLTQETRRDETLASVGDTCYKPLTDPVD
jgi:hypothetical protein